MQDARTNLTLARFCIFALITAIPTALAAGASQCAAAQEIPAYVVEVTDVTSRVGEPAVMRAILRIRVGYIQGTDEIAMVSVRLMANVIGTE